jgi:AcrR family transcriptional regulator
MTLPEVPTDAPKDASASAAKAAALRKRENTRARLLEAAEDVFVRKGLRAVTVDDLVGAAGFTRGAFYSNFSSIDEVFYAVYDRQSTRLLEIVAEVTGAIPEDEFTMDSLGLILDALAPLGERWYTLQAEFTLQSLRDPEARALFQAHRDRLDGRMQQAIHDVVRRLGREPTVSVELVAETAVALYLHSLGQQGLGFGSLDPRQLVESVLPQVILGLTRERE